MKKVVFLLFLLAGGLCVQYLSTSDHVNNYLLGTPANPPAKVEQAAHVLAAEHEYYFYDIYYEKVQGVWYVEIINAEASWPGSPSRPPLYGAFRSNGQPVEQ